MADHLDSPGPFAIPDPDPTSSTEPALASVGPPMGGSTLAHAATDITDVYAFQKPDDTDLGKSILVMNVNPLATLLANQFESGAVYQLLVDTNKDALADVTFEVTFSSTGGGQTARVQRNGVTIFESAPVSFGKQAIITVEGPFKFFAGLRSDPFFFDLLGFLDGFDFRFGDFFLDKNVFGIVLEVPNKALGTTPSTTGVWGRTKIMQSGGLVKDDRMGRAGINTVFNHGADKNIFNNLDPSDDLTAQTSESTTLSPMTFVQSFAGTLFTLSNLGGHAGYTMDEATFIASHILLPDILTYDFSKPTDYATLNGRRLQDDVIDISLNLVTKGLLTSDNVGPHISGPNRYLDHFPYLGTPS